MKLKDKVALITGAGSGIGRAMALRFAAEGASVVVADIVAERVDEVVADIQKASGTALGVNVDVSVQESIEAMVDAALQTYDRIDILCNNAGVMDKMTPVADVTNDLWQRIISINLTGPMLIMRHILPLMVKQGGGVILNTASTAGLHGAHAGAAYVSSKHGLIGLTKNTAYMYAQEGIRCNAIAPGGIETSIGFGGEPNEFGFDRMKLGTGSMPRIGKPEEVAQVALMLVSDETGFVNGAVIPIDGGWTAY